MYDAEGVRSMLFALRRGAGLGDTTFVDSPHLWFNALWETISSDLAAHRLTSSQSGSRDEQGEQDGSDGVEETERVMRNMARPWPTLPWWGTPWRPSLAGRGNGETGDGCLGAQGLGGRVLQVCKCVSCLLLFFFGWGPGGDLSL